jgi:hypothetical protein
MGTPCTSILLAVDRDTPCKSILLAMERDTQCTSILLEVEIHTPWILHVNTSVCGNGYTLHVLFIGCAKGYTLHVHTDAGGYGYALHRPYCWRRKRRHLACPYCLLWNCTSYVKYEVRSPKFIWAHVYSCTHWLRSRNSPLPPDWAYIHVPNWSAKIDNIFL